MISKILFTTLIALALSQTGCSTWNKMDDTGKGAVIGGGSGAVLGSAVGGTTGTIVGGAVGAGAGALVGREMERDRQNERRTN